MYKIVQASRLYQQIVEQIEQSIVAGELKPGDQLPAERDLAQRFGVSRTAVREAVKALREKGLVEAYPGRGTFIMDGTSRAIRQGLDFRFRFPKELSMNQAFLRGRSVLLPIPIRPKTSSPKIGRMLFLWRASY